MTPEALRERLRAAALSYPQTREDHPWGHPAFKVKDKAFLFMDEGGETVSLSLKLPDSNEAALALPFAKPTRYGLGRHGWVSLSLPQGQYPVDMLADWLHESFLAVAPKRLGKTVGEALPEAVEAALLG